MGEKILTERPILLIRNNEHSKFDSWAENIVNLVKDLPHEKLKKFLELADNEYFDKTPEFLYLKGVKKLSVEFLKYIRILRTNGINVDDGGTKTAIFHHFSRINHSCGPNSVRNIVSEETGELCVIAARDIEKGEEISIKYFDMESASLLRDSRRLKLLNWGFSCCCDVCNLQGEDLEINEDFRKKLQVAKAALQKCPNDPFDTKSLKEQMTIEKLIIQLLRNLESQLLGDIPDHLMSLHHVTKLLLCHGMKVSLNVEEFRNEAQILSRNLGSGFYNQYLYWDNLTANCCQLLKTKGKKIKC